MLSIGRLWTLVVYITNHLTLNPFDKPVNHQVEYKQYPISSVSADTNHEDAPVSRNWPKFQPPGGNNSDPKNNFTCEYPEMKGWYNCSTPTNRECWLRHPDGREFNIYTDYEKFKPIGRELNYTLYINDTWWNADGINFTYAKLFDNQYPGPWIQACWGDVVNVRVINNLNWNGTSIHWHGIRQNATMRKDGSQSWDGFNMDGVNGINQCPIAPEGKEFTYRWDTVQYGSAWYHSHYTAQYADGLLGPLTIHGPTAASFDEAKVPTLMSDWGHNSAFQALHVMKLRSPSIIMNGVGNAHRFNNTIENELDPPPIYTIDFDSELVSQSTLGRPKRYLLRLINTSFATTFIFSIDHHMLQVVSADFVSISPYWTNNILVGIGQRYNVIVEAKPSCSTDGTVPPPDGNYWIRTWVAKGCGKAGSPGYEKVGILRYNPKSTSDPISQPWLGFSTECSDEPYDKLKPKVPWTIGPPRNEWRPAQEAGEHFYLFGPDHVPQKRPYPLAFFALVPGNEDGHLRDPHPMQINYSRPIILEIDNYTRKWPEPWMVIPENFKDDDWVYMLITGKKDTTFEAHPMHLHGHDFALLQQSNEPFVNNNQLNLHTTNPPRRDVVLLPANGFVVIAFKTDNPGAWLLHCHIAWHISEGLGFQILERQKDAEARWPLNSPQIEEAQHVCKEWKEWWSDCKKWWPGKDNKTGSYPACHRDHLFQDDSGV